MKKKPHITEKDPQYQMYRHYVNKLVIKCENDYYKDLAIYCNQYFISFGSTCVDKN